MKDGACSSTELEYSFAISSIDLLRKTILGTTIDGRSASLMSIGKGNKIFSNDDLLDDSKFEVGFIATAVTHNGDFAVVAVKGANNSNDIAEIGYILLTTKDLKPISSHKYSYTLVDKSVTNEVASMAILPTDKCLILVASHRYSRIDIMSVTGSSKISVDTIDTDCVRISKAVVTHNSKIMIPTDEGLKQITYKLV